MDILGDAPPERYSSGGQVRPGRTGSLRLLVILSPQAMTDPTAWPRPWPRKSKNKAKPVFAVWMGAQDVAPGIQMLNEAGIPTFETPEEAVDTFMEMYSYTRNLELLQETPPQLPRI